MIRYMNVYLMPTGEYHHGNGYPSMYRARRVRAAMVNTGARCVGTAVINAPV